MAVLRIYPALLIAALAVAAPASAQSGRWGEPDWHTHRQGDDSSSQGRITVNRFLAQGDAASALGHGRIAVVGAPGEGGPSDPRELAIYEAAVIDRLAQAGYDTASVDATGGQITEITISHDEVAPPEAPHRPVSGAMEVGVGSRGSSLGMALNIDLSKPRQALVATRLEARIRDRVTRTVLWEGRADVITRDGDRRWSDGIIATRLAGALFGGFPGRSGESVAVR